jgi:hypothetical protein
MKILDEDRDSWDFDLYGATRGFREGRDATDLTGD